MGMMYFQVEEDKIEKVSEYLDKGLHLLGKAMTCIEDMKSGSQIGQRGGYGNGGYMGQRDNYPDRDREMIGERRWGNQYGGGYTNNRYGGTPYVDPMMY